MPGKEARIIIIITGGWSCGVGEERAREERGRDREREPKELFSTFITIKT